MKVSRLLGGEDLVGYIENVVALDRLRVRTNVILFLVNDYLAVSFHCSSPFHKYKYSFLNVTVNNFRRLSHLVASAASNV